MTRLTSLMVFFALALVACDKGYVEQRAELEKFVAGHRIGSGADYWLIKHNAFGEAEKVAVVFGFVDDGDFCREVAILYMQKYPRDRYGCELANR